MNIKKIFDRAKQYRWMIIVVFMLTVALGFFFLRKLPKDYRSEAKLSTGLLDPSRQLAPDNAGYTGPDIIIKLNQQFSTIMEIIRMPKNISLLSYRLIIHDLRDQKNSFTPWSGELLGLTDAQRREAIAGFEERLVKRIPLTPLDQGKINFYQLVTSMAYDGKNLNKKLEINHEQNSDFISVAFTSHNTLLSVFAVNTLSRDFINNYSLEQIGNKNTAIDVLDSLLKKKEAIMNDRIKRLKDYKINNGVLNLDKQSQIVYQQIVDNETRKNQALIDKQAAQAALKSVNEKLAARSSDKYLGAEVIEDNRAIINLKTKVAAAEDNYLINGYKAADKKIVDSLQSLLGSRLLSSNDQYVSDPLIAKQSLVQRRISLGIEIERATAGLSDIERELAKLNSKFTGMVPFDAGVQDYERNADVATKEYLEILARYNQTSLDKNIGLRLQLAQEGIPTLPESSKKPIYLALSAIASFVICFCILFLMSVLDHSVKNGTELQELLGTKIVAEVDFIRADDGNLERIWDLNTPSEEFSLVRKQLRKARFELDNMLLSQGGKVLGIADAHQSDAFTVLNLAYAFASMGKKILLIGGPEFLDPLRQLKVPAAQSVEELLKGSAIECRRPFSFLINNLNGRSLLEVADRALLSKAFVLIRESYDMAIINLEPLTKADADREWLSVIDVLVATFAAGSTLSDADKINLGTLNLDERFAGWIITGIKKS